MERKTNQCRGDAGNGAMVGTSVWIRGRFLHGDREGEMGDDRPGTRLSDMLQGALITQAGRALLCNPLGSNFLDIPEEDVRKGLR